MFHIVSIHTKFHMPDTIGSLVIINKTTASNLCSAQTRIEPKLIFLAGVKTKFRCVLIAGK